MPDADAWADAVAAMRATPREAGIFVDFDGTLARIVPDPDDARPIDGVAQVLEDLARRLAVVAVLSGRPVAFLQRHLPATLVLSGLYGLEVVERGERREHPDGRPWRGAVEEATARAVADAPAGTRVESKGLSLTLHYRERPDLERAVRDYAEAETVRSGLVARPARMSVELHPPIAADKGSALDELSLGLSAVVFVGDDVGDLPAFAALDRLRLDGVRTGKVAVRSVEASPELLARSDVVVDGPEGALRLLASLVP